MITSRTKKQLLAFLALTLIGVSYVGAHYARLDRVFTDTSYAVNAHFTDSGGIFQGSEVTYRGVGVGKVSDLQLTRDGVTVVLDIDDEHDAIPADARAVVGNKSAVGEQYVDLQPQRQGGPYLRDGADIESADTAIPIATTELLTNLDDLVQSVPQDSLRTSVSELGTAFEGGGRSLGQIIDTSNEFIASAQANFDTTSALIRDSRVVLRGQADKASAIRSFSQDLALFSGTVADEDRSLRRVIENGSATADELRTFLEDNDVELASLIRRLVTTGEVVVKHLDGIEQILVLYPYVVEGGFSVVAKGPDGKYDAEFGLILNEDPPVCTRGYESTDRRNPQNRGDRPMNTKAHCAEGPGQSNARGSQNVRGRAAPASYAPPVVATYDQGTGRVSWTDRASGARIGYTGGAADAWGRDSWKWMLLQPDLASGTGSGGVSQ